MEKTKDTIGVIGYRGSIGRTIVSLLEPQYLVIKGTRNKAVQEEHVVYVDAYDPGSVERFCERCTILINAAGPSYLLGDRIAVAACKKQVKYIDVFGGNLLREKISAYAEQGRFIICAGSVPGLSGALVKYLIGKCPSGYQKIQIYQGGREAGGVGGLSDIILSMLNGYGHSGRGMAAHKMIPCSGSLSEKIVLSGAFEAVYVNPYLTEEIMFAAEHNHSLHITSYQIFPDKESMELLAEGSIRYRSSKSETEQAQIILELYKRQEALIAGKVKWFAILLTGESQTKKWRILIKAKDSTWLTALIAVMSAQQLLMEEERYGLSLAYELLDGEGIMERIRNMERGIEVEYTEEQIPYVEMTEGVI